MDILSFPSLQSQPIHCVEMHTTGEPTRIVVRAYAQLYGTLLQQRQQAKSQYDNLRRRLILEPRGHFDMYGAILRQETELTASGEAHMGVLFVHNEGYSTMCGHATIALGRFLLDTQDLEIFPRRKEVVYNLNTATAQINLHAPCGLLEVTVPTTSDGSRSDPTRPVSFVSVPSFATAIEVDLKIPSELSWPELGNRNTVRASFAYGGAFYCFVDPEQLGFQANALATSLDIPSLKHATKYLKAAVIQNSDYQDYFKHPESNDLSFLYGVVIVDKGLGRALGTSKGAELGLCFFADQEIDRSPTGSAVAARVALAFAKGDLNYDESWTYHSLLSNSKNGKGGFIGTALPPRKFVDVGRETRYPQVQVRVEGFAFYTGFHTLVVEKDDPLGDDGFVLESINALTGTMSNSTS